MSLQKISFPGFSSERPFAGYTPLIIAFAAGALLGLLPLYFFYASRDAVIRGEDPLPHVAPRVADPASGGEATRFASRLSYELARLPKELPAVRAKAPAPQPDVTSPAQQETVVTPRVVNARPINPTPQDPREPGQEALKSREPAVAPPRGIVSREVETKSAASPATPTRPIVSGPAAGPRQEFETERRGTGTGSPAPSKTPSDSRAIAAGGSSTGREQPLGAPVKAAEAPGTAAASGDTLAGRLAAGQKWLLGAEPTTHTLQILGVASDVQLNHRLGTLSKNLDPGQLKIFRTVAQGKPWITVVYGAYPDRASAVRALQNLPAEVSANKPVVRTVKGIRAELEQLSPQR